jgi:hypothetical protein
MFYSSFAWPGTPGVMFGVRRECRWGLGYLLALRATALLNRFELCLFSKNCGNGPTRLAYSTNCQAHNARPLEGKISRKPYEPRWIRKMRTGGP